MAVFISSMHVALKFIEHKMFEMYKLRIYARNFTMCLFMELVSHANI